MKLQQKIPQPKFGENPNDPFDCDSLGRGQEIKTLTRMIEDIASPATMAINADWGAGKTAFIKMWRAHLNIQASVRAFYFNAWETDFSADPLVPFMAAIVKQLPKDSKGESKELVEKAKALIPILIGDVMRKFVGDETAQVAKNALGRLLDNYDQITEFKSTLEDFAKAKQGQRIVIFVDELDRCRPDYAVKVLERIKHLFEVPGIVFVLATNREQLCHSVNSLYGDKLDADAYLRRFIEFDYAIKQPAMDRFIEAQFKGLGISNLFLGTHSDANYHNLESLRETLTLLAEMYNLSLRDMEHLLARIVFALRTLEQNAEGKYQINPVLLAFFVVARMKMRKHYDEYIRNANNWQGIIGCWESGLMADGIHWNDEGERAQWYELAAFVTAQTIIAMGFTLSISFNAKEIQSLYEEKAGKTPADKKEYYERVAGFVRGLIANYNHGVDIKRITDKIEMLHPFRF